MSFLNLFRRRPSLINVGAGHPTTSPASQGLAVSEATPELVDSMQKVGPINSLVNGESNIRVPAQFEYSIVVLETKPKRAAILFDADDRTPALVGLRRKFRVRLRANGYIVEPHDRPCTRPVLKDLVDEHRTKNVTTSDEAFQKSEAAALWEHIVDRAVAMRATDIHFFFEPSIAYVKVRVDKKLRHLDDAHNGIYTPSKLYDAIAWAYMWLSENKANSQSGYDGDLECSTKLKARVIDGKKIIMRFQSLPGLDGPKVTCRILRQEIDDHTLSYEELGFYPSHVGMWREAASLSSGLILIAGATNSGKTTALKTYLETHPGNGSEVFISLDNPIEYRIKGVHSVPLVVDLDDPEQSTRVFSAASAALLRSDPDATLIGEIRDEVTGAHAQKLILLGHWGAATVHAKFIRGIIPRLVEEKMGMSLDILTSPDFLNLLVYQSLVPLLCPHCRIAASSPDDFHAAAGIDTPDELADIVRTLDARFQLPADRFFFARKGGCQACGGDGTHGLTVVAEMLLPDSQWLALTKNGDHLGAHRYFRSLSDRRFDSENMVGKTIFEHALHKAYRGLVDPRLCRKWGSFNRFEILSEAI